jgi:transcriptional regulator with XRE-family HTH domain
VPENIDPDGAARSPRHDAPLGGGSDEVPRRLREARERAGLSLRQLAKRLDISASALSQIETGKSRPSVRSLYAVVSELGLSLDELFDNQGTAGRAAPPRAPDLPSARRRLVRPPGSTVPGRVIPCSGPASAPSLTSRRACAGSG